MPLPRSLARFNRVVTNRVSSIFAGRAPGFAIIHHVGRKSGTTYSTPLNAFSRDDEIVVALTYGSDTDWLANARAAGGASIEITGKTFEVGKPRDLTTTEGMAFMPPPVRFILGLIDVDEFVAFPVRGESG